MLQHNRQWLRWVPFILWIAAVIVSVVVLGENVDLAMAMALLSAPVGLGIPIVGAFVCHRPRTRRVYAGTAIAGAASIGLLLLLVIAAAMLSVIGDGGSFIAHAGEALGRMLVAVAPLLVGALMTTVLMIVWTRTAPKPEETKK